VETKALLHAQNSLSLADYSVKITGLDSSNRGLGGATGLDGNRGLGEATGLDAATGVLAKPRGWTAGVLAKPRGWTATGVLAKSRGWAAGVREKSRRGGSRGLGEATVRRRSMNGGALSTPHPVL
jgi:hypothetical protein